MKRTERKHLKENELADLASRIQQTVATHRTPVIGALVAVVLVVGGWFGYSGWRSRTEGQVGEQLAEAMTVLEARVGPPEAPGSKSAGLSYPTEKDRNQAAVEKFKQVADRHPETEDGRYARFREAGLQMALGNMKEAAAVYQQVIETGGDSLYAQMARLGLAEAQARAGEYDKAIQTFKELSERTDGPLPVDGILMQLGRTYLGAGKATEAQQTFDRLVKDFPDSPFVADARRELDGLKKS